jgi:PPM family protein phosphatase
MTGEYVYAYADHIGDRKEQQDRVAVLTHDRLPGVQLAVLADGMGGHTGGAIAAQAVLDTATEVFKTYLPEAGTPEDWLRATIMRSHEAIQAKGKGLDRDPRSTCVIALAIPGELHWAHVGDSRLYFFRDGQFVSRTEDHSLVELLLAQGTITEADVATHPERSRLFQSIGGNEEPSISFGSQTDVESGDTILLCSDGLWAYFHKKELADLIGYRTPDEGCQRVVRLARTRSKREDGDGDNISVAIVRQVSKRKGAGLLGGLFKSKLPPPSNFEDCRRYLIGAVKAYFGPEGDDIVARIERIKTPEQMDDIINRCAQSVEVVKSPAAAQFLALKARELLQ